MEKLLAFLFQKIDENHLTIPFFIIEWDAKQEDQTDVNVWEDNWDDDAVEDDFSVQLRSELENQGMKMES